MADRAALPARLLAVIGFFLVYPHAGPACAEPLKVPYLDTPIHRVIDHFREQGYPFAYSTNLVPDSLLVSNEPASRDPLNIVIEILQPHGLTIKESDGIYLVIREIRGPPPTDSGSVLFIIRDQDSKLINVPVTISGGPGLQAVEDLGKGVKRFGRLAVGSHALEISAAGYLPLRRTIHIEAGDTVTLNVRMDLEPARLENLQVSTSRYVLFSNSQFFVDQRAIQNLPGNGDDPLRTIHRLPGAAAGGWSAKTHFRGGEEDESAIFLNGLRLIDPFHVRDFHNVFSSIDSRTISGVEAYTGGFPVSYGDRMSGLLLLQSQKPVKPRAHELGLSVFNTSLLSSGYTQSGKIDWLFSARKSNLDLVLDRKEHGNPDYYDMFGTLGFNSAADTRITLNILRARDQILVITEHLPGEQEESSSDTRNQHVWMQIEKSFSANWNMSAVISSSALENTRNAIARDTEQLFADVIDRRDVDVHGIRTDFSAYLGNDHLLTFGVEARKESADYHYESQAEYNGFYLAYPGVPELLERSISGSPSGESYAAYVSDRWQVNPRLVIDSGLRWDKQTWIGPANEDQVSPRFNMLYSFSPSIDLRLTWGRYHQSQQIQQLQLEDGVDRYFPSQRADHLIAGGRFRLAENWSLRVEAFEKKYGNQRPRFENLLDPVPLIAELEPDRIRVAPQSGRARGAEFTVEFDGNESINGWASYTLSRVTDRVNGVDQPRNWDQRHSFQAAMAYRKKQWEVGLAVKVHSGWPTTPAHLERDDDGELELVYGARNSENLATFANVDLRISRTWQLSDSWLTAFFEINNLFDRRNQCCVDYDVEEEDEDLPPLEKSIDNWLGASPAIGLLWEF